MFQVDAFTNKLFGGNPAAVCFPDQTLNENQMQAIAAENNLAETAFVTTNDDGYNIRWFTPTVEVDLCGHATLAAAHVIFNHLDEIDDEILFTSLQSGVLTVKQNNGMLTLDFPADTYEKIPTPAVLTQGLGIEPMETYKGKTDYMVVLPSMHDVEVLQPDNSKLSLLEARGIIVTAAGEGDIDFVSRFFAPQSGISEDPVTGSAHTTLTPYWAAELGKNELTAVQLSERKGHLWCTYLEDRILISGHAVTYLEGTISI